MSGRASAGCSACSGLPLMVSPSRNRLRGDQREPSAVHGMLQQCVVVESAAVGRSAGNGHRDQSALQFSTPISISLCSLLASRSTRAAKPTGAPPLVVVSASARMGSPTFSGGLRQPWR